MAVAFTDIVGYTSQSKHLTEAELVDLVETFEDATTRAVTAIGGRVIKTIGDEVLYVADSPRALVEIALALTGARRGPGRPVPAGPRRHRVRRRHHAARRRVRRHRQHRLPAHLDRPARLGPRRPRRLRRADRPGHGDPDPDTAPDGTPLAKLLDKAAEEIADISPYAEHEDLRFRRLRRTSVKGYRTLEPWLVRRPEAGPGRPESPSDRRRRRPCPPP